MKSKSINELGILVEAILIVTMIYSLVLTLFMNEFQVLLNITIGLTLFSMAYNNEKISKKRYMTVLYVIFGLTSLIMGII